MKVKKDILLIFTILFFIVGVSAGTIGDIDGNGKINSLDYVALRKKILSGDTNIQPVSTTVPSSNNNIEVYFLNTLNYSGLKGKYKNNNAFVVKTSSNKYILIDTGVGKTSDGTDTDEIKKNIYNQLKDIQKSKTINLDYMVISHMHSDHAGNAVALINDDNIKINTLILKEESKTKVDEKIVKAATAKNIPIIDTKTLAEGKGYTIDSNVSMYLFNVKDAYDNTNTCEVYNYLTFVGKHILKAVIMLKMIVM